jgi:hypothetical protein
MDKVLDKPRLIRNYHTSNECSERDYTVRYLKPFLNAESKKVIANVQTNIVLLDTEKNLFPVTINFEEYNNSYVCSPYTACISYAKEEMSKLNNKPLEKLLSTLSILLSFLLKKATINKVISVNNWLLSTNLYSSWDGKNIPDIKTFLSQKFRDHAIMFRSLNRHSNSKLMNEFKNCGFILIPSRQIYFFDKSLHDYWKRRNTRNDLKLLQKTNYKIVGHADISEADYPRIVELYNLLYLDKHSYYNPQFTQECIANWHKEKLLYMNGLRNKLGILDGIIGCFEKNGITSAPLVGYDTKLDQNIGLYRMLIIMVIQRAKENDLVLNLSSGASDFKRVRGGIPFIEYSAVYIGHLPVGKKMIWHIMNFLLTNIGVPIMKRFKL